MHTQVDVGLPCTPKCQLVGAEKDVCLDRGGRGLIKILLQKFSGVIVKDLTTMTCRDPIFEGSMRISYAESHHGVQDDFGYLPDGELPEEQLLIKHEVHVREVAEIK